MGIRSHHDVFLFPTPLIEVAETSYMVSMCCPRIGMNTALASALICAAITTRITTNKLYPIFLYTVILTLDQLVQSWMAYLYAYVFFYNNNIYVDIVLTFRHGRKIFKSTFIGESNFFERNEKCINPFQLHKITIW